MASNFLILLVFYVGGHCQGTLLERHYSMLLNGTKLLDSVAIYSGISRIRCCNLCTMQVSCYYVSYDAQNKTCELTSGWDAKFSEDISHGWDVYNADIDCPHSSADFVELGLVTIAICHNRITRGYAMTKCERAGARLVQPDSEIKFTTILEYIRARPNVNRYVGFFTDGRFINGTWKFDDGGDVPAVPALFENGVVADGSATCLRLKPAVDFLWDDKHCTGTQDYICEQP